MDLMGIKLTPQLILLIALAFAAGVFFGVMSGKGLGKSSRQKIVEAAFLECQANSVALAATVEKNENEAYEVLEQHEEFDNFSKTPHKVVVHGKKLHNPATGCTVLVRRAAIYYFMQQIPAKFNFSEENKKSWNYYSAEMKAVGAMLPGQADMQVTFTGCVRAKKLYEGLQSFFASAKANGYNFNF